MSIIYQEVSYIYNIGTRLEHIALENINLDLVMGKMTAIIGETGSGKSTLIQQLNGLLIPTSGTLTILNYKLERKKKLPKLKNLRKQVGMVFQFPEYQLFCETVLEDVMFGLLNFGVDFKSAKETSIRYLKLVGIEEELFNVSPFNLSGGQKRRVALAGILALEPAVLVLDEPTAGLDPQGSKSIMEIIANLNKTLGVTIIVVSHDLDLVLKYFEYIVVLNQKKLITYTKVLDYFNQENIFNKPLLMEVKSKLAPFFNFSKSINYEDIIETIVKGIQHE